MEQICAQTEWIIAISSMNHLEIRGAELLSKGQRTHNTNAVVTVVLQFVRCSCIVVPFLGLRCDQTVSVIEFSVYIWYITYAKYTTPTKYV
jgi:hypothetical protein